MRPVPRGLHAHGARQRQERQRLRCRPRSSVSSNSVAAASAAAPAQRRQRASMEIPARARAHRRRLPARPRSRRTPVRITQRHQQSCMIHIERGGASVAVKPRTWRARSKCAWERMLAMYTGTSYTPSLRGSRSHLQPDLHGQRFRQHVQIAGHHGFLSSSSATGHRMIGPLDELAACPPPGNRVHGLARASRSARSPAHAASRAASAARGPRQ